MSPARLILVAALVIALMIVVGHVVAALFVPLFWITVVAVGVLLASRLMRTRQGR